MQQRVNKIYPIYTTIIAFKGIFTISSYELPDSLKGFYWPIVAGIATDKLIR
jgi:hypothetical protein